MTFETTKEPSHVLHYLLPARGIRRNTRDSYHFCLVKQTSKFSESFVNYCVWKNIDMALNLCNVLHGECLLCPFLQPLVVGRL